MRVFITGGAGFIGSHLCDLMLAKGNDITILDDFSSGSNRNISHISKLIKCYNGDIRDRALVDTLVKNSDLIFHMAAALGVAHILKNPIESISTNLLGSIEILNAAINYDKRIFIASTSEIYGKNPQQPLNEASDRVVGSPQRLRWTYSDAKALEESIGHALYLSKSLRLTTVRFFNTVGPRQNYKLGMVLPNFIKSALENKPINIYGSGKQSRVFCHVKDATEALYMLSNNEKTIGKVYNIGGIQEITVLDLAGLVIKMTNSNSNIKFIDYNDVYHTGFEEIDRRVPDISKIKFDTNWCPKFNLNEIIEDIISSMS